MPLPQRLAATPDFIPHDLRDAAPGHRYQLYLQHWQGQNGTAFAPYKKATAQGKDEKAEHLRQSNAVLKDLCPLPTSSVAALKGIRARQQSLLQHYGDAGYRISTISTAPFATGLGNEHPIENGFAFLTPYGLPYLAGSGVKGILRRAAEEIALENDTQGTGSWTWLAIWFLFGFEGAVDKGSLWDESSQLGKAFLRDAKGLAESPEIYALIRRLFDKDKKAGARFLDVESRGAEQFLQACMADKSLRGGLQNRGALDFWDVFPKPFGDKLVVEIMTPHFGSYYQGKSTPHDSGAPIPVSFLAVPAKSDFDFHVVCHPTCMPESLQSTWRDLLQQAFDHAFEWVGFGAKTSVGYGAMQPASMSATPSGSSSSSAAINSQGMASNITNATETWPAARIKFNRANGTLTAENNGAQAHAITPQGEALLNALPPAIQAKIRRNEFVKIKVSVTGNTLVKLEA